MGLLSVSPPNSQQYRHLKVLAQTPYVRLMPDAGQNFSSTISDAWLSFSPSLDSPIFKCADYRKVRAVWKNWKKDLDMMDVEPRSPSNATLDRVLSACSDHFSYMAGNCAIRDVELNGAASAGLPYIKMGLSLIHI